MNITYVGKRADTAKTWQPKVIKHNEWSEDYIKYFELTAILLNQYYNLFSKQEHL